MRRIIQAVLLAAVLFPGPVWAGAWNNISLGVGYYIQPSTDTGGTSVTLRLPYGTLPRLYKILPDAAVSRMYWSLGGRFFSQGPSQQPPDGLFLTGLGVKLHELLGATGGASHYLSGKHLTTMGYLAVDLDFRIAGQVLNQDLLKKFTGPLDTASEAISGS